MARPEDYGFSGKAPSDFRKFMQWGSAFKWSNFMLDGMIDVYRKYAKEDATKIWGWGVGKGLGPPAFKMGPFVPQVKKDTKLPFFINHTRRATQWAKPAHLNPNCVELVAGTDEAPPLYGVNLGTRNESDEVQYSETRHRLEAGAVLPLVFFPELLTLPILSPDYEECRGRPDYKFEHDRRGPVLDKAVGYIYFQHNISQCVLQRDPRHMRLYREKSAVECDTVWRQTIITNARFCNLYDFASGVSVHINRSSLWRDSYEHIMVNMTPTQLRRSLRAKYIGEAGIDYNAIITDWVTNMSIQFGQVLFEEFGDEGLVVAKDMISSNPCILLLYRFFGRFIALAMYHEQTLAIKLALPLMRLIKGEKVRLVDLKLGDKQDFDRLDFMIGEEMNEEEWEYYYDDWQVQSSDATQPLKKYAMLSDEHGLQEATAFEDRKKWVVQFLQYRVGRRKFIVDAIRHGFNEVFPLDMLDLFTAKQFQIMLCGLQADIDVAAWRQWTNDYTYAPDGHSVSYFFRFLTEAEDSDKRLVLQYVSGRKTLPAGGFEALFTRNVLNAMVIWPYRDSSNQPLHDVCPYAATCFCNLYLPTFSSYEKFEELFRFAINNCTTLEMV